MKVDVYEPLPILQAKKTPGFGFKTMQRMKSMKNWTTFLDS